MKISVNGDDRKINFYSNGTRLGDFDSSGSVYSNKSGESFIGKALNPWDGVHLILMDLKYRGLMVDSTTIEEWILSGCEISGFVGNPKPPHTPIEEKLFVSATRKLSSNGFDHVVKIFCNGVHLGQYNQGSQNGVFTRSPSPSAFVGPESSIGDAAHSLLSHLCIQGAPVSLSGIRSWVASGKPVSMKETQ